MKVPPLPRSGSAVAAVLAVLALSGCSQGTASPADVAERFEAAMSAGDLTRACELLTPQSLSELEDASGLPCRDALTALQVPAGGGVLHVEAWGRAAIVEMEHDTLFLARTGETWAVRAAGCTPVPEAPYDCVVTGG